MLYIAGSDLKHRLRDRQLGKEILQGILVGNIIGLLSQVVWATYMMRS